MINKTYDIAALEPYINWLYFYHAWGLSGKPKEEKLKLRHEAEGMLQSWYADYHTHALFGLFQAVSDGDDIIIEGKLRFPMLRQQHPTAPGQPNLCLADFLCPKDRILVLDGKSAQNGGGTGESANAACPGIAHHLGVFCTTVDAAITEAYRHDEYQRMMAQTLCDRLAEATAEKLHEEVRRKKDYWGYAPDEQLTIEQQHREEYQGIRPAIGYPSLPDTSANFIIDQLLDMKQVGIRLTETGMMTPHASVSGLMFAHSKARYFELGKIGDDQLRDYARRRGVPVELMRTFLQSSLLKK